MDRELADSLCIELRKEELSMISLLNKEEL